jgi:hypothetical protein
MSSESGSRFQVQSSKLDTRRITRLLDVTTRQRTINWLCGISWAILLLGVLSWVNLLVIQEAPKGSFWMPPSWWLASAALLCKVINQFVMVFAVVIALASTGDLIISVYGPSVAMSEHDQHAVEAPGGS